MNIEIQIGNSHLLFFIVSISIILALGAAVAYQNPPTYATPPSTMGHSVDEMDWSQPINRDVSMGQKLTVVNLSVVGNLSIGGFSAPRERLHIYEIFSAIEPGILLQRSLFYWRIRNTAAGLQFLYNIGSSSTPSPVMNLTKDGNLSIGGTLRLQPLTSATGVNGLIYYDSTLNKFRCFENGAWKDCISAGAIGGGGTANYIPIWTGASNLGSSLIYQSAAGNVGIGTTSPTDKLSIANTGVGNQVGIRFIDPSASTYGARIYFDDTPNVFKIVTINDGAESLGIGIDRNTGNVGIGTTSPGQKLEVAGDGKFTGGDMAVWYGNKAVTIRQDGSNSYISNMANFVSNGAESNGFLILTGAQGIKLKYGETGSTGSDGLTLDSSGNVGIGTTSPSSGTGGQLKLDVEGPAGATKYCDESGNDCRTMAEIRAGMNMPVKNISITKGNDGSTVCLLMEDNTVKCSGYSAHGELGRGGTTNRNTFNFVGGLSNVKEIASETNRFSICALLYDGTARCWGSNDDGELGTGDKTDRRIPAAVEDSAGTLANIKKIATRQSEGGEFACALLNDGTAKCWGYNGYGQLGVGGTTEKLVATTVSALNNVKDIDIGGHASGGFACALLNDGTAKCWGYNGYGQLGVGDTVQRSTPITVLDSSGSNLAGVASIKLTPDDYGSTYALLNDGTVKSWGYNGYGQLGVGDTTNRNRAVQVLNIGGSNPKALKIENIGSGSCGSVCALLDNGGIKCWGFNAQGQLGVGDTAHKNVPTNVVGITSGAVDIQGFGHGCNNGAFCALFNNGRVKCWGNGDAGKLGYGYDTDQDSPVTVLGINDAEQLECGGHGDNGLCCAVLTGGSVRCWGYNGHGALGIGDTTNSYVPVEPLH